MNDADVDSMSTFSQANSDRHSSSPASHSSFAVRSLQVPILTVCTRSVPDGVALKVFNELRSHAWTVPAWEGLPASCITSETRNSRVCPFLTSSAGESRWRPPPWVQEELNFQFCSGARDRAVGSTCWSVQVPQKRIRRNRVRFGSIHPEARSSAQ